MQCIAKFICLSGILDVMQLVGYAWADEPRSAASVIVTGANRPMQTLIAADACHAAGVSATIPLIARPWSTSTA